MSEQVASRTGVQMSLRVRIALLSGAAVGAAIALTAVATFFVVRSQLYDQFDADLLSRTEAISQAVASYPVPSIPVELLDNARVGLLSLSADQRLQLPEGATVGPPWSQTELAVAGGGVASSLRTVVVDGQSLRVAAVPSRPGTALVVALPTDPVDQTLHDLALILLLIGFLGVVGAAGAGYVVARAGLRPVAELTAAAEAVARTEELSPIRVRGDDEIGRLAKSFNAMLASLDAARQRERQLVADAGHELRTPLTSIRTNLDLLAQSDKAAVHLSPVERASLLNDVRAQIHELGDLVGDLMQLSRGV
ncbi:MAG: HAMP domain-containing protein, partial [Candidatus Nanopelagicales bacterium]